MVDCLVTALISPMPDQATSTKTDLRLGIKVAIFTGLIGAGAVAAALFVKNLSSDETGGGGGGGQPALKMTDLNNVEVVRVDGTLPTQPPGTNPYYLRFASAGGSVTFGRLNVSSVGLVWVDGSTYVPAQPIRVELVEGYGPQQYPAIRLRLSFVLSSSVPDVATVDVCLPDQRQSRIQGPYWIDVEGAGYFDVRLTSRYFGPCAPESG